MDTLSTEEKKIFAKLNTPEKIQDFLNTLAKRTDEREPIVRSPRMVLKLKKASCIEGALLACAILAYHKKPAELLDLRVGKNAKDVDHVVALTHVDGYFGAISKTSHAVLRYREPIYKTLRELALSYFHEYFTDDGKKNLREYSTPFSVIKKFGTDWVTSEEDLYEIASELDNTLHFPLLTKKMEKNLRRADSIEITAGKLKEKY